MMKPSNQEGDELAQGSSRWKAHKRLEPGAYGADVLATLPTRHIGINTTRSNKILSIKT